ncbi:MAG: 50S ribosomal protein L10 [Candidatus Omnitrophota bacterium]
MAKTALKCKESMVKEILEDLNSSPTLIVTNYRGLKAQELNELRRELRTVSGDYVIVKNSMAKRALTDSPNNRIADLLNAEVGIVIGKNNDPSCISKVLIKFSKGHEVLKICGGVMEGAELTKEDILHLASLPSRGALLSMLASALNAPIQGLACSLKAIISKLVYALDAVKNKKPADATPKEETPKAVEVSEEEATPEVKEEPKPTEEPEEKKDETEPKN